MFIKQQRFTANSQVFTYHSFLRQRKQEGRRAWRTTAAAVTKSSRGRETSWETRRQQGRQAWETRRQRQPRAARKRNHEGRQVWETMRQRQPRPAQKRNHEGRQARETRRQWQPRAAQDGNHEKKTSFGDKAAAASRPFGDFGNRQPSH